jgi:hypothetical protein
MDAPRRGAREGRPTYCDQCPGRAFVTMVVYGADLHFCHHHWRRIEPPPSALIWWTAQPDDA